MLFHHALMQIYYWGGAVVALGLWNVDDCHRFRDKIEAFKIIKSRVEEKTAL